MKVIIAGSRTVTSYQAVVDAVQESGFDVTEVISGGARGVDTLGERFASSNDIPLTVMRAEWDKYGKRAGYLRNRDMANYAGIDGGLVAVWDGESRGTRHMIEIAEQVGLQVYVKEVRVA